MTNTNFYLATSVFVVTPIHVTMMLGHDLNKSFRGAHINEANECNGEEAFAPDSDRPSS
jgi:hypothetical protein